MCFTVQLSRFVVSVSQTAHLFYLISFCLSSSFLSFFQTFLSYDLVVVSLTTWILYHIFCLLSTVNFIFLKFFLIVCFSKTIICDSSVIIPLGVMLVNHKFQFFQIFLEIYFYRTISFLLSFIHYAIIFLFIILYVLFFIIRLFAGWRYAGRIFNAGICRGKAISEFRSPKALPLHPHPLGHGSSSSLLCVLRC